MADLIPIPNPGAPELFGDPGDPVVVVLHDEYGRTPGLVHFAEALSGRAFRVAVPDLFGGVCTTDSDSAAHLMGALDIGEALASINDAMLEAQETSVERVGLVGFSFGGWLALLHAQAGAADAVVGYYASLAAADHGVIPCPALLHWAESDEWSFDDDPGAFVARLRDHGTPVTEHRYLGTGPLFANASLPDRIDTQAAALAFARSAVFLERTLRD